MEFMSINFSSAFNPFFLPLKQHGFTFLQLPTYRPVNHTPSEDNKISKKCVKQAVDGKGKWTFDQQKKYLLFLSQNMEEMRQKSSRKSNKVFLKMSQLVKTRTGDQCRSHHQKILKYHQTLQEVIRYYTEDVYSLQKIFGSIDVSGKEQLDLKSRIEQQNVEVVSVKLEGRTFRILINEKQINDYDY